MVKRKFMQQMNPDQYRMIKKVAKKRGITVQEMIRVMVPEWLANERAKTRR